MVVQCVKSAPARDYGKIVLTLENCLLSDVKVECTPSGFDGLDRPLEEDLRMMGCELIQTAGILLRLPQTAMATGQILFHRFYFSKSFVKCPMEVTAMAAICLASKIEEAPRRNRDVINVFNHIKQVRNQKTISPVVLDSNYVNLKNQVIKAERRILKELGFCVHVQHPHKMIVMYLRFLRKENNSAMLQYAWNAMNDLLRTDVFTRHQPETVAAACIFLAARVCRVPLPSRPHWFHVFGMNQQQMVSIAEAALKLYRRSKPDAELLEKTIGRLRVRQQDSRLRNRLLNQCGSCTPQQGGVSSFSPAGSQHNSPSSLAVAGVKTVVAASSCSSASAGLTTTVPSSAAAAVSATMTDVSASSVSRAAASPATANSDGAATNGASHQLQPHEPHYQRATHTTDKENRHAADSRTGVTSPGALKSRWKYEHIRVDRSRHRSRSPLVSKRRHRSISPSDRRRDSKHKKSKDKRSKHNGVDGDVRYRSRSRSPGSRSKSRRDRHDQFYSDKYHSSSKSSSSSKRRDYEPIRQH